jgi:guanylate kinase
MSIGKVQQGVMLVLSSPSGAGKTTIAKRLLAEDAHFCSSVSVTTRAPRPGEVDGRDYHFLTPPQFEQMVADDQLLEYATVFGNSYGTPRTPVEEMLALGRDVLFDIDWQGCQQLKLRARKHLVSIFVLPPSLAELKKRLVGRGTDSPDVIQKRLHGAMEEIGHAPEYDYIFTNHNLDQSVTLVRSIIEAEKHRKSRQDDWPARMRTFREEMAE